MRSAIIAAALVASVVAVPLEKRAVVYETNTEVDVVYATVYTTVTGGAPTATTEAEAAPTQKHQYKHWGHNNPQWWGGKKHTKQTKAATTTEAAAPTYATWEETSTTTPQATWEAPTTTAATTAAAETTAASSPPDSSYQGLVLHHHNIHRANHSAPDIQWDAGLASTAQKIANLCVYEHNTDMDGGGYGQNIAAGVDASGIDRIITDMFYNGEINYYPLPWAAPSPDMSNFEKWGHMSQIVWHSTTKVGCATTHCTGGLANTGSNVPPYFTVCNYDPPGNFANEYYNVKAPKNFATVEV